MTSENHLHSHLTPNMKLQGLAMILVLGFTVVLLSYCIEAKSTHISPIEYSGRELNDEFTVNIDINSSFHEVLAL